MLSTDLPVDIEKHFYDVVQDSYNGNLQEAIKSFLKLHERFIWKLQLLDDVESLRSELRIIGGIKQKVIDDAVKRYRKDIEKSSK